MPDPRAFIGRPTRRDYFGSEPDQRLLFEQRRKARLQNDLLRAQAWNLQAQMPTPNTQLALQSALRQKSRLANEMTAAEIADKRAQILQRDQAAANEANRIQSGITIADMNNLAALQQLKERGRIDTGLANQKYGAESARDARLAAAAEQSDVRRFENEQFQQRRELASKETLQNLANQGPLDLEQLRNQGTLEVARQKALQNETAAQQDALRARSAALFDYDLSQAGFEANATRDQYYKHLEELKQQKLAEDKIASMQGIWGQGQGKDQTWDNLVTERQKNGYDFSGQQKARLSSISSDIGNLEKMLSSQALSPSARDAVVGQINKLSEQRRTIVPTTKIPSIQEQLSQQVYSLPGGGYITPKGVTLTLPPKDGGANLAGIGGLPAGVTHQMLGDAIRARAKDLVDADYSNNLDITGKDYIAIATKEMRQAYGVAPLPQDTGAPAPVAQPGGPVGPPPVSRDSQEAAAGWASVRSGLLADASVVEAAQNNPDVFVRLKSALNDLDSIISLTSDGNVEPAELVGRVQDNLNELSNLSDLTHSMMGEKVDQFRPHGEGLPIQYPNGIPYMEGSAPPPQNPTGTFGINSEDASRAVARRHVGTPRVPKPDYTRNLINGIKADKYLDERAVDSPVVQGEREEMLSRLDKFAKHVEARDKSPQWLEVEWKALQARLGALQALSKLQHDRDLQRGWRPSR